MELKMSDEREGTVRKYEPSASVEVPVMVPFSCTEAKGTPSPVFASTTLPFTCTFWAKDATETASRRQVKTNLIFFIGMVFRIKK